MRSFEIRFEFESAVRFESDCRFENFRIESAVPAPLFVVSYSQTIQRQLMVQYTDSLYLHE